ncbi:glycoside hydrolase family 172 protein [Paenibacillus arenilitoris]|uniref:DUF2961 domain-containing protein n=1 Tax=Paenibacillus arenilitoris TaxID=2772299 RepID=A0A927H4F0_9BACL|nr:glycoside hydrolase family 172 protein [Paenibacillus arenilitoris]MBD2867408.1 DUF2961 domain-containing protein [Paenibacillus arenilitoris]
MQKQAGSRKAAWIWIAVVAAVGAVLASNSAPEPNAAPEPYGLEAMSRFDRLPYLTPHTLAGGASSYDRSEGNYDGFGESNFLYQDEHGDKVMLDAKGPGTVYRMWFTGFNPIEATIKIYFDGETEPRVDMMLMDLLAGTNEPFLSPLVVNDSASSGGFVSYLPLPYAESIKVTTNGAGESFFYNFGYHTFSPDTEVASWDGTEDSAAVRGIWSGAGTNPVNEEGTELSAGTADLAAGSAQTLLELEGPREMTSLKLSIPGVTPLSGDNGALNDVRLRLYWDGEAEPSVDAPLGAFFAMGQFGPYGTRSLPAGMDDSGVMYAYFPMPFERSARVELANEGAEAARGIAYEIRHRAFAGSFDRIGYFKTRFSEWQAEAYDNKDLVALDVEGAGKFIGVVQSLRSELNQGPVDRWHLEGDEKIFVDGSLSPAVHGTGTEDFYNGGWYFNRGLFTQPLAGYTAFQISDNFDSTTMYRFMTHDAIPFRSRIQVRLEHGGFNDVTEQVWLLAYYYHRPESQMVETDMLDVGNEESELGHGYELERLYWEGSSIHPYEGAEGGELITDNGRAHTGYSAFELKLDPDNDGAVLRRRFDQTVENQSADVYVDGKLVGTWYRAGSNGSHSWRDDDFLIPPAYTEGKSAIRIKIAYKDTAVAWNEYRYTIFSLLPQRE